MTRQEKIDGYDAFVEKFKPKKTTDDCFTPPEIYEVIKDYVCGRWRVDPRKIVRPFWPGEDYETFDYPAGAVVIDNPPFSILSKIIRFYQTEDIPYFLFCPSLTALSGGIDANHIICDCEITYENSAVVRTSFVTSFGRPNVVESSPELTELVNSKMREILKSGRTELPKYTYPNELVTAAMVQRYAKYGINFEVGVDECVLVRALDAQRPQGKSVYGAGLLISARKAAEKAAAEKAAAEKAGAHVWELSERERAIVEILSQRELCAKKEATP